MYYHVTPVKNVASILRTGLVPFIGERARACGETTPVVYLFGSREDVDTALMNWLGDEFDNVVIVVLQVQSDNVVPGDVAYEFISYETIAPECIQVESIE